MKCNRNTSAGDSPDLLLSPRLSELAALSSVPFSKLRKGLTSREFWLFCYQVPSLYLCFFYIHQVSNSFLTSRMDWLTSKEHFVTTSVGISIPSTVSMSLSLGSKKMSNKFPTLMTPSAFTVKKDSRLQKTDSFEEGHYPMNNDPHGLCVIISNKDFQSGAEIIEKEKGKVAAEDECPIEEASIKQAQAESLTTGSQGSPENEEPENIAAQSENFESGSENASLTAPLSMMQPETLVTASENVSDTTNGPPEESENLTITTTTPEEEQRNNASIESSNFTVQPQDEMTEHATSAQGNLVVNQSTENTSTANTINNEDSELNDTDLSLSNTSLEDVPIEMDDAEFNRQGTEVDEKQLRQTFEWLNFKVVPIHNCTGQKMRSELKAISKMDHKKYDAFICCILSHGYEDGIYGTDWDLLPLSDIRKMFTGERCKGLLEKPKIFFFQACRGSNIDIGSLKFHKATESEYTGMSSAVPPKDQAVGFDGGHLPGELEEAWAVAQQFLLKQFPVGGGGYLT